MGELRNIEQPVDGKLRGKIWNHMGDLTIIVDSLNDSVITIEDITKTVCISESQSEVSAKDVKEPSCELSLQLIEQISRIKTITSTIHSINNRIQL